MTNPGFKKSAQAGIRAPELITQARSAAKYIHAYMGFRAAREAVAHTLSVDFYTAALLQGADGFFGIQVNDQWNMVSDEQNPEAFEDWRRAACPV